MNEIEAKRKEDKIGCGKIFTRNKYKGHCGTLRGVNPILYCDRCLGRIEGKKEARKEFLDKLYELKNKEREGLNKLPDKIAIQSQTGWLMGYADLWTKIYTWLEQSLPKSEGGNNGK